MFKNPSCPENLVAVPRTSTAPVLYWNSMYLPDLKFLLFPPIHFLYIGNTQTIEPFLLSEWNKNLWWLILLLLIDFFQCQTIQMIVMIMRNDDQIDVRQVLNRNPRFHEAFRTGKTDWRGPLCHMWIS